MTFDELVALCLDVQAKHAAKNHNLPPAESARLAMCAVLQVAASRSPGIAAHLEWRAPAVVPDELELRRLEARALPLLVAVAREASVATGGDVTVALLRAKTGASWLTPWRHEAWARLARAEMTLAGIGLVFRRDPRAVSRGIRQHEELARAARAGAAGRRTESA